MLLNPVFNIFSHFQSLSVTEAVPGLVLGQSRNCDQTNPTTHCTAASLQVGVAPKQHLCDGIRPRLFIEPIPKFLVSFNDCI